MARTILVSVVALMIGIGAALAQTRDSSDQGSDPNDPNQPRQEK